ncbi:hypothetical protein Plhal304r1_c025g0084921 [Plasmopara halstedii]
MRAKFYAKDSVFDLVKPFERPPIALVYSVYGFNVPTKAYHEHGMLTSRGLVSVVIVAIPRLAATFVLQVPYLVGACESCQVEENGHFVTVASARWQENAKFHVALRGDTLM